MRDHQSRDSFDAAYLSGHSLLPNPFPTFAMPCSTVLLLPQSLDANIRRHGLELGERLDGLSSSWQNSKDVESDLCFVRRRLSSRMNRRTVLLRGRH